MVNVGPTSESYIYRCAKPFNPLLCVNLKLQGLTKSELRLSDQGNWGFFSNATSHDVLKIRLFSTSHGKFYF